MKTVLQLSRNSDGQGFVWGDIDLNPVATFDDIKSFEELVEKAKFKAEELISEGKLKTENDVLRVLSASPIEVNFWGEESKADIEIFTFKEDLSIAYENEYDHEEGGLKKLVDDGIFEKGLLAKLESCDSEETANMVFENLPNLQIYYLRKAINESDSLQEKFLGGTYLVNLGQEMGLDFTSGDLKNSNIIWKEAGSRRFNTEFEVLLSNEASDYSNGDRSKDPSKLGKYWLGSNYAEY